MHIPTADTDTLELLPFREALEKSGIHFIEVTFKWRSNKYCNKKDTGK